MPEVTKKRILVCDDDESIRNMLIEALEGDYFVDEVSTGDGLLRMFERMSYDLLIIDIKLPNVDGLSAIEKIRAANAEIPIIICTAYGRMKDDFIVKSSNIAAFYEKPFDLKALKLKIWELVGS